MQLLVLSHVFVVRHLKRECEKQLEHGLLTAENVVDIFQLALLCDAPRLGLICHRMIQKNFKTVSATEGWQAMKQSHPVLERQLLEYTIIEDNVYTVTLVLNFHPYNTTEYHELSCASFLTAETKGANQKDK